MPLEDFSPHQQKIIKRYYANQDQIASQRLAELVADLYLAEGKKKDRLWATAATAMQKAGVPQARVDHIMTQKDPAMLARLVKELEGK
jgi:hypothetical protein